MRNRILHATKQAQIRLSLIVILFSDKYFHFCRRSSPSADRRDEMGSQSHAGNDRPRVSWTASMERYFIDLMLDQLQKGRRLGHTFNKQAWTEMITMFNTNFGTKYDRDTLKSHYSILWKQYNDVKKLLEHTGFHWDENCKMVIGDGHAWDAYVKTDPDVQVYRNRALVNFNDMRRIYEYTQADGRYSLSSHDRDLDDEYQTVNAGAEVGNNVLSICETINTEWTPAMDQYFIELMLDQVRKGNKTKNSFSKQAWKDMLTLFNGKFCVKYRKRFLRNQYKKLLKYYLDIKGLLEQRGFMWDAKQKMIVADDAIWDSYVKDHPDRRSYRKKKLVNYQELGLIFSNTSNNGSMLDSRQDKNIKDNMVLAKTGCANENCFSAGFAGLKTHWRLPMDHYLIDLLLDQALKGNKIGYNFMTEAWTEMLSLFNTKFGSHYSIRDLKKRYKHLRKQYNDITTLLEESGFSWDDGQQMVTAEESVWDSYMKVHSYAQLYRNKSLPSYHKLCVIYGQENSNRRSIYFAHAFEQESEDPDFMTEELPSDVDRDCSNIDWTPSMDRYLIDLMLEQVREGNMVGYSFSNMAWVDMAVSFVERFGLLYDKDLLKLHHRTLGVQYNDMTNLLRQKGFSWDEKRQMVTAAPRVWDAYVEEHPDAELYRSKPAPYYNDLCLIYGNSTSVGKFKQSYQGCSSIGHGAELNDSCFQRTDWTAAMDRYFIDCMLEQVRLGSMINKKFSKLAWSDIVVKFRAEFGSQHDGDALQKRFMDLRKQFNKMNNVLGQCGFAWDETQQMIIASHDLWDSYVKECPDVELYRYNTLPNYNDLVLIYASDAGQSSFSHSMETEDYPLGEVTYQQDDQSPDSSDPQEIHWTKPMESYFIRLMLEQVCRGNKTGHAFNERAWAWMTATFNKKFKLLCDKETLEQRYFGLMKEYDDMTDLHSHNAIGRNYIQQPVISSDGSEDAYYEMCSIEFRGRSLDKHNALHVIYADESCNGKIGKDDNGPDTGVDNICRDLQMPAAEFGMVKQRNKKRKSAISTSSMCSRKVQRPIADEIEEATGEMPSSIIKIWVGDKEKKDNSSIETIVDALQTIPDMDDELFLEACKLLEDEKKAKIFIGMDVNQRQKWLLRKLQR